MDQNRVIPAIPETTTSAPTLYTSPAIPEPYSQAVNYTAPPVAPVAQPVGMPFGGGAQNPLIDTDTLGNFTLLGLIETFVAYAFIMAAALAAVFIFVGGISFILSAGNDEKIKQAINTIRYSIIGLIVTLLSFTFIIIVGRVFGLDFMQYMSFNKIRNDISALLSSANPAQGGGNNFEVR